MKYYISIKEIIYGCQCLLYNRYRYILEVMQCEDSCPSLTLQMRLFWTHFLIVVNAAMGNNCTWFGFLPLLRLLGFVLWGREGSFTLLVGNHDPQCLYVVIHHWTESVATKHTWKILALKGFNCQFEEHWKNTNFDKRLKLKDCRRQRYAYRNHSRAKRREAASAGMLRAVSRMMTVIRLAPVTEGTARVEKDVRMLPKKKSIKWNRWRRIGKSKSTE